MSENFVNDFVTCSRCKERLHIYHYAYVDKDTDSRDTEMCLSCRTAEKYERALGCNPRSGVRLPDGTPRRHVEA